MMNRYFYPQKFYKNQYWMDFSDIVYLLHNLEGSKDLIFIRETFLSFIYRATSPDGEEYVKSSPLFTNNNGTYACKPYIEALFHLLKLRFKKEYAGYTEFDYLKEFNKINILVSHTLYLENNTAHVDGYKLVFDKGNVLDNTLYLQEDISTQYHNEILRFGELMMSIMEQTYDRYATLLKSYDDQKANLLNKVEAITRFNDTPQDSGEFADDRHTTHITTSKNDYDTIMARIDEIDRNYRNLLKDWTSEFEPLFIHEEGL